VLPNIENTDELLSRFDEIEKSKTKTYRIVRKEYDFENAELGLLVLGKCILGKANEPLASYIGGYADGLVALQQHILLLLSTEADKYIIYPYTYGITTLDLIGKPSYYVMAVIPERITETLLTDDRVTDVSDFEFEVNGNKLTVKFVVHSIYGEFDAETVVIY
jgi:hypothetical protein